MDNKMTNYIIRHSRKRDEELKYDFMPSMLEIIERPAHKAGKVIILGIFTLLIVAVIWACLSETDVVISANGSMQPEGNLNVVKTYQAGKIEEINVSEGQYVSAGDVLFKLNTESLDIDTAQLEYQKNLLETQKKIYTEISNGEDISDIDISEYDAEIQSRIKSIIDMDNSYKNTLEDLEKEKSNAELNKQIAEIQLKEYEENGTERQTESQELLIKQYELSIEQREVQINDKKTQYSSQINSKLSEINSQIDEISTNVEKYALSKKYQQIIAPVSGYINSLNVNTIGDIVSAAEELVTIVPDDEKIEMVSYVKNMDIAEIEVGTEAEIKLEAYPYNKYGTVKGKIRYISPSSFANKELGNVYLVKIEITEKNDKIDIKSGLSGIVEIKIDKRSIMDYFLDPIKKGFGESLKEK